LTQDGSLVVCDAKLIRDDSAAFRHDADEFPTSRMLAERAMTPLERSARQLGPTRRTAGDIVLVTSGAGVAMMMMDLLADHGLRAASFMDNLRGAPDETNRPIARCTTEHQGDRLPGRDGVTVARRADRSPLGLDRGRARCSSALRPVTPRHGPRAPIKRSADCTRLVSAFTDPVVLVKAAAKALR